MTDLRLGKTDSPIASTAFLTLAAMIAFAANSLLCRLALGPGLIDPASFTVIRVVSGALTLTLIVLPRWRMRGRAPANWRSVIMLSTYLVFFSFAYLSLGAGTGALVLFGSVQLTMFVVALRDGERLPPLSWVGFTLAVLGLVYLMSPGLAAPDPRGAVLMAVAGIAWGAYSLLGRRAPDPMEATANNFIYSVPLVILTILPFLNRLDGSWTGVLLAAASGSIASGLGYVVWYSALRGLTAARAATVQLSVPVITALGGVILLSEPITWRLILASAATLGGVWIVLAQRAAAAARAKQPSV